MAYSTFYKTMLRSAAISMLVLAPVVMPQVAQAQSGAPLSQTIPLTFTGKVTSDVANTIMIRNASGVSVPYTGPVPEFPYKVGDTVTISFNATVPTQAFYTSGAYQGQVASDGIYTIKLASPYYSGPTTYGIGNATTPQITGVRPSLNSGQPTNVTVTLKFDTNTNSYTIDGSTFASGAYSGPGFIYDSTTGTLKSCAGAGDCMVSSGVDPVLTTFKATDTNTISSGAVLIYDSAMQTLGNFFYSFTGSWNLPQTGSGAVSVPEPGMMVLFGAGALVPVWRRRRARKGKDPRAG